MSNLTLPTMTYAHLRNVKDGTIAYATTIRKHDGLVSVYHHHNLIAEISPDSLWISNAGWTSSTTTNRLSTILRDNSVGYRVYIKAFAQWMARIGDTGDGIDPQPFSDAAFEMTPDGWALVREAVSA